MSTPPRIEPSLQPGAAPPPVLAAELRPQRSGPPPAAGERSSWLGHLLMVLLTLLGLVLLLVVALRWLPPPTTAYMLQSPTTPVQYQWVPASRRLSLMRLAAVAAEDQKFWTHQGFDFEAIEKAEAYNRNEKHHRRGASTISQQTAKNLFLWPGGWLRKGIEAGLTVLIEKTWGKRRILEMYLNIAEFGPGVYGAEAASQAYFGKPAALLTPQEAARLAAVLPNPRHWSVRNPGAYVQARSAWILEQMGYGGGAPDQEPAPPQDQLQGADDDEALQAGEAPAVEPPPAPAPPSGGTPPAPDAVAPVPDAGASSPSSDAAAVPPAATPAVPADAPPAAAAEPPAPAAPVPADAGPPPAAPH
jgi:monofunctional biosynthetic peptidoglycan transglycosylase